MTKSVLSNLYFNADTWVITIFNGATLLSPHAVMLVEGIKEQETEIKIPYNPTMFPSGPPEVKRLYCVYQYDIFAAADHDEGDIARLLQEDKLSVATKSISNLKAACKNTHGFITNIREYKAEVENREMAYTRPGGYDHGQFRLTAKSFLRSAGAAQAMIDEIRAQALRIRSIWSEQPDQASRLLPRYQYRGQTHPFGDPLGGLNCAEWCYSMVNISDRIDHLRETPAQSKPKPCAIL